MTFYFTRNIFYHILSTAPKILRALNVITEKYLLVEMDSTFYKVDKHGLGALKKYGEQANGVSRGGKTTKIHVLVNEYFQLLGVKFRFTCFLHSAFIIYQHTLTNDLLDCLPSVRILYRVSLTKLYYHW